MPDDESLGLPLNQPRKLRGKAADTVVRLSVGTAVPAQIRSNPSPTAAFIEHALYTRPNA
jgi:hypothetical protein